MTDTATPAAPRFARSPGRLAALCLLAAGLGLLPAAPALAQVSGADPAVPMPPPAPATSPAAPSRAPAESQDKATPKDKAAQQAEAEGEAEIALVKACKARALAVLKERSPSVEDIFIDMDGLTVAKANLAVEDTKVQAVLMGEAYIKRDRTDKVHRFLCLAGEGGKVLLTFFTER